MRTDFSPEVLAWPADVLDRFEQALEPVIVLTHPPFPEACQSCRLKPATTLVRFADIAPVGVWTTRACGSGMSNQVSKDGPPYSSPMHHRIQSDDEVTASHVDVQRPPVGGRSSRPPTSARSRRLAQCMRHRYELPEPAYGDSLVTGYESVERALSEGANLAMLCTTCPWDRNCVTPPTMTKADVDAQLEDAKRQDREATAAAKARGEQASLPMGSIIVALAVGGRHQTAAVCPVFVARLRSSNGREVVDGLKAQMRAWDDEAVAAS